MENQEKNITGLIMYFKYYWDLGNNSTGGEFAGDESLYNLLKTGSLEYVSNTKSNLISYLSNWDLIANQIDLDRLKCSLPEAHAFCQGPFLRVLSKLEQESSK